MLDLGNPRRLVRHTSLAIPLDGVVGPRPIPQAVDHLHVLLGNLVPLIMWDQGLAKRIRGRLRPTRDDIPGDAAFRQVVESAEGPREWEGIDVACAASHAERD